MVSGAGCRVKGAGCSTILAPPSYTQHTSIANGGRQVQKAAGPPREAAALRVQSGGGRRDPDPRTLHQVWYPDPHPLHQVWHEYS